MIPLETLYAFAEAKSYDLYWIRSGDARICSMSVTDGIHCAIMMDPSKLQAEAEQRQTLAHELGHCVTGSFYNRYAKLDLRQKHENRADKWAIEQLVPADALGAGCRQWSHRAVGSGRNTFGSHGMLMKKALCWYHHGNLASELYE